MNKDTKGTAVRFSAKILACQFYCTYESCIFMGEVRAKLDCSAKV